MKKDFPAKFLRYNPDRRRRMLNRQEKNENLVEVSTNLGIPCSGLQLGLGSPVSLDSCVQQEAVKEELDVNDEEDDGERVEFGEDRWFSVNGVFKFVFALIAVILTAQAICSMNSSSYSQTLEGFSGVNSWQKHVYGLNFSEVGYAPIRIPDILVERSKKGGVYEEFVEVQNAKTDDYVHQDEAEIIDDFDQDGVTEKDDSDSNVIQEEILQETDYLEAETVDFNEDELVEEDDSDSTEAELKAANDMEDGLEEELHDVNTNDVLINIKFTSFDPMVAMVIGHILLFTSFGAIYRSRCKKVEKDEFKELKPSTNPQSLTVEQQVVRNEASLLATPQQNDAAKEISHGHIPSVELLGEFVFGEETSSSNKSPKIQKTETSQTVKKQRGKNAEVVTPSSVSVRRSSRLKTRSSVMSQ